MLVVLVRSEAHNGNHNERSVEEGGCSVGVASTRGEEGGNLEIEG